MLMNENSELRSFVSCSKNFLKNKINKSIKNNIVPINNDGGVKEKRKHRGFIPSTFSVTVTYTFFLYIFSIITTYILFCILMYILFLILICIIIYILFLIFAISLTTKKNASFIETGTYLLIYIL